MAQQLPRPDCALLGEITYVQDTADVCKLDEDICTFVQSNEMPAATYESRRKLVALIADYVQSEAIGKQLELRGVTVTELAEFGSFAALCATRDSDLDLCICAESGNSGALPVTILQVISDDLMFNPETRSHFAGHELAEIEFVSTAKVPIIKLLIDGVPVDLSASLDMGPPQTSLAAGCIRSYCQYDERVRILAIFLKIWMKSEVSEGDFLRDFPNSYSLTLLLIHVLQWFKILPNFHGDGAVEEKWTHGLSIVQLLKLFAFHYSNEAMLSTYQFNMISGEIEYRPTTFRNSRPIQILDAYDQRNPARTLRNSDKFIGALRTLLNVIERSSGDLFSQIWWIPQQQVSHNALPPPAPPAVWNASPYQHQSQQLSEDELAARYNDPNDNTVTMYRGRLVLVADVLGF